MLSAARMTSVSVFFFFQAEDGIRDVAVTGVQTYALPIYNRVLALGPRQEVAVLLVAVVDGLVPRALGIHIHNGDRKSTRLNSSHGYISYAVFCLKKKIVAATPALY